MLLIDRESAVPPGHPEAPIALKVGNKGRLHAVLASHDEDVLAMAFKQGVPHQEPVNLQHEHHRRNVARPEKFGRYDPITSSLAFNKSDGTEISVRVGDNGRLRSVFESGEVDAKEAKNLGLPPPETYKGRAKPVGADAGHFNPLTHEYQPGASQRDTAKAEGRRSIRDAARATMTPRMNPLNHKIDAHNTSSLAFSLYNPRLLPMSHLRIIQPDHPPISARQSASAEITSSSPRSGAHRDFMQTFSSVGASSHTSGSQTAR